MRTLVSAAILSTLAAGAQADMARYELDPEHTALYFTIEHIGYARVLGFFPDVEGSFTYDPDSRELGEVQVTIDAGSVITFNQARDGHVRDGDFLDVSQHPKITFTASGGTSESDTNGTVTGDLTILGQTNPVTLNVTLNKVAPYPFGHRRQVLGLSIDTSILRSEFGMTYGVDQGLVGDEVRINIETEAMKMD